MPARYGSGLSGRGVTAGDASQSVGGRETDAEGDAAGLSALRLGTSIAEVALTSERANGPDPIGAMPNGWSGRTSTGTSARRCAGAMGCVNACRNPPSGVLSVNVTVVGDTAATVTSFHDPAAGPVYAGSWRVSIVNTTSSDVTGSPSCQRASSRSSTVHVRPVGSTDQVFARSGTTVPPGPLRMSPEKMSATRSRSAWLRAVRGLIETGAPTTPSTYGRAVIGSSDGAPDGRTFAAG